MQRTNRQYRCGHIGAVKDLEACGENGIVFASIAPATAGAACTRHYLYKHRTCYSRRSLYTALPLQATDCGDTIQLVRGLTPLIPRLKGEINMKKRIHEIKIRFSPDELATLSEQVKRAGISREQFC